jgi:hypothetical protein
MPRTAFRPIPGGGLRFLALASLLVAPAIPLTRAGQPPDGDVEALRAQKIGTDGPALLAYFRAATPADDDRKNVQALIEQLGNKTFAAREKASLALRRYGRRALPFLKEATRHADLEIARRAQRCVDQITVRSGPAVFIAALHLLRRQPPEGTVEVLLRYLPFADDSYVQEETLDTLAAVGLRGARPDPILVKAVKDPVPLRRAAAARGLGRARDAEVRAPVRALLTDLDGRVRLEAAQALLLAREKEAIPALIALLRASPAELFYQAEGLLLQAAGEKAPKASAGDGSETACKQYHDAWLAWWQAGAAGLDLARVAQGEKKHGLVLLAQDNGPRQVWEFTRDHSERRRLTGLGLPMDVRALPAGTVLVANFSGNTNPGAPGVAEYDRAGKVVWQQAVANTVAAQRLPNGNTFVCSHDQLLEITRAGKTLRKYAPNVGTLTDAVRLGNGHVVFINTRGMLKEITWPEHREVRTLYLTKAPAQGTDWYRLEPLPGARLLLASHTDGRVFEIDAAGKVVWEYKVPQAYSATRLENGNVLIATAESARLLEVDRSGRVIYEGKADGVVRRVRAY